MGETNLFEYYQKMTGNIFVLSFKGAVSQDILVGLKEVLGNRFSLTASRDRSAPKVFSVFIELAQNVLHHSAEKVRMQSGTEIGVGIVVICEDDKVYEISTGNMIEKNRLPEIINRCDFINKLDREGLKKFYKERLKRPLQGDSKSPQLGLIDIALKSGNSIKLRAKQLDDRHSFLDVSTIIMRENENG